MSCTKKREFGPGLWLPAKKRKFGLYYCVQKLRKFGVWHQVRWNENSAYNFKKKKKETWIWFLASCSNKRDFHLSYHVQRNKYQTHKFSLENRVQGNVNKSFTPGIIYNLFFWLLFYAVQEYFPYSTSASIMVGEKREEASINWTWIHKDRSLG